MTVHLYFGPNAFSQASNQEGRILKSPEMNTEGVKKAISILNSNPVGDRKTFLILGPIDELHVKAQDALLKIIEEPKVTVPVLWCNDTEPLTKALRSRCREVYCPGDDSPPAEVLKTAKEILDAVRGGFDWIAIEEIGDKPVRDLIEGLVKLDITLWPRLKPLTLREKPTKLGLIAALFKEME